MRAKYTGEELLTLGISPKVEPVHPVRFLMLVEGMKFVFLLSLLTRMFIEHFR